jgi:hypothetical protein
VVLSLGPFVEEVGESVLAACVVLYDGSELRGEEVTPGGGSAGAPLLPGVPEAVKNDGEAATAFGNAAMRQDCALACKRKTRVKMSRLPGLCQDRRGYRAIVGLPFREKKNGKEVSIVRSSVAEYLTFFAASGTGGIDAVYADENIWLTQKMMGVLYDVDVRTINYHLKRIFSDSELQADSVIRNFRITATDGKSYNTKHYSLPG